MIKAYVLKVNHDAGTFFIKTTASSEQAAKENLMKFENCPESSILGIKQIPFDLFSMTAQKLYEN